MSLELTSGSQVAILIEKAWQRRMLVLIVEQAAIAVILVMGGAALMLLLGTQILAGYWLLALAAIGVGIAAYRVSNRLTDRYNLAQLIDRRLHLCDTLSTAWHLSATPPARNDEVSRYQLAIAEQTVTTNAIVPAAILPFTGGRLWVVAGVAAALSLSLFTIRYLVTDSMSLRQSLIPIRLAEVFEYIDKKRSEMTGSKNELADAGSRSDAPAAKSQRSAEKGQKDNKLPGSDAKGASGSQSGQTKPSDPSQNPDTPGAQSADGKNGKPDSGTSGRQPGDSKSASSQTDAKPGEGDPKEQKAENQSNSNGLIDKMKDALSSMMSKIKPSANGQKSASNDQMNKSGAEDQKGADQQPGKDQKGDMQQKSQNQQMAQEQSADGQQQGQSAEKAQASQGKDSQQGSDKKGSDSHSGAGHSDGEKDIKAAEQAKAMGKLAEIIGKRSAELTGDMTVENPSGKQQLQTDYTHAVGHHADLGGEINRDQVPVEDQQYVREYMELARKQARSK